MCWALSVTMLQEGQGAPPSQQASKVGSLPPVATATRRLGTPLTGVKSGVPLSAGACKSRHTTLTYCLLQVANLFGIVRSPGHLMSSAQNGRKSSGDQA